jgi:CHASE3 domain sensor protein
MQDWRAKTLNKPYLVVRSANAVAEAIQDAERGQRGYLITGRESYLEPYNSAKEHLPQLLGILQQAVANRPEQQRRLLTLQGDLTTKMNELDVTIATRREKGSALAIVNTDTGRIAMEAVEADIDAIIDAADARLQARMATAESLEQHVTLTFLIGSFIAACALFLLVNALDLAVRHITEEGRKLPDVTCGDAAACR